MQTCYWKLQNNRADELALAQAAAFIRSGEVVAFPTETVYGLGADGLNGTAVRKIFAAKGRPADNPLIMHIAAREQQEQLTSGLTRNAELLMRTFWPGPLTLIVAKAPLVPDAVSAGLDTVGVRFPANAAAQRFIAACGCPIAAPSANLSGKPSPTNAADVLEDMRGKIAGILDGGSCGIGVESTVVDTTAPVPVILRPGGITREMLLAVLGAVELDPALQGDPALRPKAPGMKYRHYAPQAPMYLLEGAAVAWLPRLAARAAAQGLKVGVLCSGHTMVAVQAAGQLCVSCWGTRVEELAARLFYLLRAFDRQRVDLILAEAGEETGLGLPVMNRLRKAAGYLEVLLGPDGLLRLKNAAQLPAFMVQ